MSLKTLLDYGQTLNALKGEPLFCIDEKSFFFTNVVTDSRNVKQFSLFVPLIGQNQNGHKFIEEALKKGASVVLVQKDEYESKKDFYNALSCSSCFFVVKNTLTALQDLAHFYVKQFPHLKKIAITGSSGKSTVKEMVASVLRKKYKVICNEGNLNSETGLPLSVFNITSEHEVGVFEMGMNRVGEISEIASVLESPLALITNIGSAHIGILGSKEKIATEKKCVFNFVTKDGVAFIPETDEFSHILKEGVLGKIVYFGRDTDEVYLISDDKIDGIHFKLGSETVHLKLPGLHNYKNALASVAVGRHFGVSDCDIKNALENFQNLSGRSELKKIVTKNDFSVTVIEDCYNANFESTVAILDFASTVKNNGERIFVLGDMKELGSLSKDLHEKIGEKVLASNATFVIFVGSEMSVAYQKCVSSGFSSCVHFSSYDDSAIKNISDVVLSKLQNDSLVLLKASHSVALERIIPLIKKGGA
ncbi:MAG: UDP-N-acetylmuramoyl-tripeptide--D-alanyl-D-alanine ligase [Treponema sp.]|nr:UDP-N-acetylmuramoyl-tripeptide--D-alanyl-D-alanine ligase [Treponema sp.]